jgi:hypothetical protein
VSVIAIAVFVVTYALIAGERVSVRMRTDRLDEPHRGGRSVASEVGQSAGNVFELRLRERRRITLSRNGSAPGVALRPFHNSPKSTGNHEYSFTPYSARGRDAVAGFGLESFVAKRPRTAAAYYLRAPWSAWPFIAASEVPCGAGLSCR